MYDDLHKTVQDSQPVTLYEFSIGGTTIRHTSAETVVAVGSFDYTPFPGISHTKVTNSGESAKNKVMVSTTRDFELASWLLKYIPTSDIFVSIYSKERNDPDGELIHEFSGVYLRYISKYPSFKLEFAPLDYDAAKQIMRYTFSPICQHTQYDDFCTLDQNLFVTTGSILTITDGVIVVDTVLTSISADHFVGGYIELAGKYGQERGWILAQIGADGILTDRVLQSVIVGASLKLFPSCRGEFDRCKDPSLFNNKIRFVGAPNANKVNPFSPTGVKSTV